MTNPLVDLAQVPSEDFPVFGLSTRAAFALGKSDHFADVGEAQAEEPRMVNEPQPTYVGFGVESVAARVHPAVASFRLWDQTNLLIVANGLDGKIGCFGCFAD